MKIAVLTDAHANLPALEAALEAIHTEGCDLIFHVGDAIAIGPYPAECVDLLHSTANLKCTAGNHDLYFVRGLPDPRPAWMSDGEVRHQAWTHAQLGAGRRSIVAAWPLVHEEVFEGVHVVFIHYALDPSGKGFAGIARQPSGADLDPMLAQYRASIVFFGHDHSASDVQGESRYINPGSLGCCPQAQARYTVVTFSGQQADIQRRSIPYDDQELYEAFEKRNVPERDFIYRAFFGGRFGT